MFVFVSAELPPLSGATQPLNLPAPRHFDREGR
jgi:hypothetical protein